MKPTLTTILLLLALAGMGQIKWTYPDLSYKNVITDSVVWRTIEVIKPGDTVKCKTLTGRYLHDWVYSETWIHNVGCCVLHHGFHCDWDDKERFAICSVCKRKIHEREFWYQHRKPKVKSEYELLDEENIKPVLFDTLSWVAGKGIKIDQQDSTNIITISSDTVSLRNP